MKRFEGLVVAVTGASRGIGRETALRFAQEGAIVACLATSFGNAEATVEVIKSHGGQAVGFALDVSSGPDVEAVFARISEELGTVSVLVNNAGIAKDGLMMRLKDEDWDRVISVNLKGTYNCIRATMKGMMKARHGRIVNVTSIIGLHGAAGQANYAASKAGIVGLTMSVAKELGSRNITCNAVAPGFIETDMTRDLPNEMKDGVVKTCPLGRLGTPADIAKVILFLASEEASYMTGQTLTIDGGLTL